MSDVLDSLPDAPAAAPGPVPKPLAAPPAPAPGSAPDPLDALPSIETPLQQAYQDTSKLDPNRAAEVISLARRIGEPEAYVDKNLPDIKKAVDGPDASELKKFADANPEMAKFLIDRRNMAVAKDDLPSLGLLETAHRKFTDAVEGAKNAWESGDLNDQIGLKSFDQLMGIATPETQAHIDAAVARVQELDGKRPKDSYGKQALYGATAFIPQIVDSTVEGGKYAGVGVGLAAIGSAFAGPGFPAAFSATARPAAEFGFKFGVTEYNARLMAGLAYHEMKQIRDKDGNPLPDEIARPAAFATGIAAAGLGFIKMSSAMKLIPGGEAFLEAFTKATPKAVIESEGLGAALKSFASNYAHDVAHGTAAMVGITATNTAGVELAKAVSGQPFEMAKPGEVAARLAETAGDSLLTFGALGFPKAALGFGHALHQQSGRAELAKNLHETLAEAAANSKLLERLPEGFRQAAKQVTEGGTAETTYIPVERFDTLFQGKKADPKAEAARLGVEKEYAQAKETGGDVAIPTADLITTYGKTDMLREMSGDVKYSPEHLTLNEVAEVKEQAGRALEAERKSAEGAMQADATTRESADRIYSQLKSSYESAISDGLTPAKREEQLQVADAAAKFWARRAAVEGPRRGVTPEEWFNSVRPTIQGEKDASQAAREGGKALEQGGKYAKRDLVDVRKDHAETGTPMNESDPLRVVAAPDEQVRLASTPEGKRQLKDMAVQYLAERQGTGKFKNDHTGWTVEIPEGTKVANKARGSISSESQSIATLNLPELLKEAKHVWSADDRSGSGAKNDYLYAPLQIGDKGYVAKFILKAEGEGKKYYTVRTVELEEPSGIKSGEPAEAVNPSEAAGPSGYTVANLFDHINARRAEGDTHFQGRDLDMSKEARFARAKAMGFNTDRVFYHGTTADLEKFKLGKASKDLNYGRGVYVTNDPQHAEFYTQGYEDGAVMATPAKGGNILPVLLNVKNTLNAEEVLPKALGEDLWKQVEKVNPKLFKSKTAKANYLNEFPGRSLLQYLSHSGFGGKGLTDIVKEHGYDSIQHKDEINVFDPKNLRSVHAAFDPAESRSSNILHQDEQKPRGQINLSPEGAVIKLFRSADASTFMHESAHLWLQDTFDHVLDNSDKLTEDQSRDWGVLKDWLKIEEGQQKLTTEQHEQFARGFEAYLREGNAPSEALKGVFAKFREWLTAIYKDARGLNVQLTDEVRGVMDRMLATEEEIAQARESIGDKPMPDLPGVPKESLDKLAKLQAQAHEKAVTQLLREQMKELKESHREFLAKKKAEIEEKLRPAVADERPYKIQDELKSSLDDKRPAKSIAREFLDGKAKEEAKGQMEAFAELHGFSSADEMAKLIMATDPIEKEVAKRTRVEMAKYADMKDTDAIKGEALRAIHNDKQIELMAAEREILQGLVRGAEITDIARARRSAEAKVEASEIKARAREMMRKMNIRGATAYLPLFTAERRAAERAARAMVEGDYERAATLKRQQMLNHALAIESLKISKDVDKWTDYLKDLRTKDPTYFSKEEHFNQVAELLRKLGMGRTDYDPENKKESLAQWAARMPEETNTLNLPDWVLDDSKVKPMKELTINELSEVVDALKNIVQVARFEDRAYTLDEKASLQQIVHDLSMSAAVNGIDKSKNKPKMVEGPLDSASRKWNRYILSLHKVETVLRKMDGYQEGGKWQKIFYDSVYRAANDESRRMADAKTEMEKLWSVYDKKERSEMVNEKFFSPELGTSTTKMHLLMMAMNLGNDGNREKLFNTRPLGVEEAVHWDEHAVMSLLSKHMTERDWNFVQGTWDMINSLWPDTEALHKRVTGFSPDKVEAVPLNVKTTEGKVLTLKGGYFPLKEDTRASVRADQNATSQDPLYTEGNPAWKASTRTGHTKARTDAQYSVSLSPTLIHNHMRDVIHDISFRETILDLRRLLANRDLQETVRQNIGTEGYAFIKDWLGSVAGGNTESTDAISSFVRAMRGKATVATIMMKPGVILQHLANPLLYPGAIEGFGWKEAMNGYFKRGVLDYHMKAAFNWKAAEEMKQFVFELSPFMRDMHESPDRSLSETFKNQIGEDSGLQKFAGHLIAGALETSSIPMWLEAYSVSIDRGLDSADAVAYADRLVSRVQGSGRKYDAPGIQRGGELGRTMAMYMTFLNAEFNRWAAEKGQVQIDKKSIPGLLGFLGSRLLLFSTVSGLLGGKFFKDENSDESVLQAWLKESFGMPMAMFPGLRDISSVALDQMLGIKSMGYHPSPAYTAIESGLDTLGKTGKYLKGDTEGQRVVESATKSAAYIFGYPDMVNQWIWNGYDYYANGMKPEVKDLYHRRPKRER